MFELLNRQLLCVSADGSYESRGVVVLDGLGVAEGFEDGIGLQQLLLQLALRSNTPIIRHVTSKQPIIVKKSSSAQHRKLFAHKTAETNTQMKRGLIPNPKQHRSERPVTSEHTQSPHTHTRLIHFQHTTLTWNSIKILIKTIINFAVTKHKKATKTSTKIKVKPEISSK